MAPKTRSVSLSPPNEIAPNIVLEGLHHVFKGHQIRIVQVNQISWFVADDLAKALEYAEGRNVAMYLDPEELAKVSVQTAGGPQNMIVVRESGVYHLIIKSRKAAAKDFRQWLMGDVIPQIRRTGSYDQASQYAREYDARLPPVQRATLTLAERELLGVFRGKHPALIYIEPTEDPYIELIKSERLLLEVDNLGVESLAHVVQAIKTQWDGLKKLAGPTGCDGFFRSLSADTIGSVIGTAERLSSAILNGQYRRKSAFGKLSVEE